MVTSEPLRSGPPGARVKAGTEVSGNAAMAADATQSVATRCQTPHVRAVVLMQVLWDPAQRSPSPGAASPIHVGLGRSQSAGAGAREQVNSAPCLIRGIQRLW